MRYLISNDREHGRKKEQIVLNIIDEDNNDFCPTYICEYNYKLSPCKEKFPDGTVEICKEHVGGKDKSYSFYEPQEQIVQLKLF